MRTFTPGRALMLAVLAVLTACSEAPQQRAAPPPPKVTVATPIKRSVVDRVIKSGLQEDDRVIVNGLMRARPGQKVTPETQAPPLAGTPEAKVD